MNVEHIYGNIQKFHSNLKGWRDEAIENFDAIAGHQWDEQDEKKLREDNKVIATFNQLEKFVNAVVGIEIMQPFDINIIPTTLQNSALAETADKLIKTARNEFFLQESNLAFFDAAVCGYGCTGLSMETSAGQPLVANEHIDIFEMSWDWRACKENLSDARWIARSKWYDKDGLLDAMALLGFEISENDLIPEGTWDAVGQKVIQQDEYEDSGTHSEKEDPTERSYRLTRYQWWEPAETKFIEHEGEKLYFFSNDFPTDEFPFSFAQDAGKSRCYKQVYVTSQKLFGLATLPGRFSYHFITGKYDRSKGYHYGIVRAGLSPQRYANKLFSTILTNIATAGQGIFLERDAVENLNEFLRDYSNPSKPKFLAPGGAQRVVPSPRNNLPIGLVDMMQFSISSIPDTMGINLEMLGLVGRNQPGVLESQRKQAGLTVLGHLYSARRQHAQEQGHCLLKYCVRYLSDSDIITYLGREAAPFLQPLHRLAFSRSEVKATDVPYGPDQKQQTWALIIQALPVLLKMGLPPQIWSAFLDYSPFPYEVVKKINEALEQPPSPEVQALQKAEADQALAEVEKTKSETALNIAKAKTEGQGELPNLIQSLAELQMKKAEGEQKLQLEREKAGQDMQLSLFKHEQDSALESDREARRAAIEVARAKRQLDLSSQQEQNTDSDN